MDPDNFKGPIRLRLTSSAASLGTASSPSQKHTTAAQAAEKLFGRQAPAAGQTPQQPATAAAGPSQPGGSPTLQGLEKQGRLVGLSQMAQLLAVGEEVKEV